MNEDSPEAWQVFTEAQFRGATVNLNPGERYENLEHMGLTNPVKSFRKAPAGWGRYFRNSTSGWDRYFRNTASGWVGYFQRAASRHLRRNNNNTMREKVA